MSDDPQGHDGLRQLLIQQFMLHEVQHHHLSGGNPLVRPPLLPVAHSLIDIYKCLHQGEFGVGHTIDHPERFKQRLNQEIRREAAADPVDEPAVEAVSADGAMLRVNLRPLRRFFNEETAAAVEGLTRVCLASARIRRGSASRFFDTLDRFKRINQAGGIALAGYSFIFPNGMVETFLSEVRSYTRKTGHIPVLSHSASYRRFNRPAYRVVERSVLQASPMAALLDVQS